MSAVPSTQQIAYMVAHEADNLRPNIIVCVSVCACLSALFVATRLFARWVGAGRLLVADYLVIFAFCLYIPYCVVLALCTNAGLGKHIIFVTNAKLLQVYFITSETIYSIVIVTIKWSILAFYWRIFPQKWFRRLLLGVGLFMGAWMVTTVFAICFQCTPFAYNWDTTIPGGHCINIGKFALVTSILNVLTDVAILILPLPQVWQLHVSRRKQWGLTLLFALGGGACVVGITRAAYIGKLNTTADATWDNVPAAYLSTIEILAGFVVSCIPSYPVLYSRATYMSRQSGSSGKPELRGSDNLPARQPAVSWNRITNTDDLDLDDMVSQPQASRGWETMEQNDRGGGAHRGDMNQRIVMTENERPGEAIAAPEQLADK